MAYGVTSTGFIPKTLQDIKSELEDALRASFGASIDVSPQSNLGQIIGVMAERYADLWAQGESIYAAFTSDGATGAALDNVCALTGTQREAATASTVTLTCTGNSPTVLTVGRQVSNPSTQVIFQTTEEATIGLVSARAVSTAYTVGQRRRNGTTSRVYECVIAGTTDSGAGPTTTASAIVDGSVTWKYLGDGVGVCDVPALCTVTGPQQAVAASLTNIVTAVSGWSTVTNLLDAVQGADIETDAALRLRREQELRGNGRASVEAIRAALLLVPDVLEATVFENVLDVADVNGLPPHSIECLVLGGLDVDIQQAIYLNVAAGVRTYGSTSGSVLGTDGQTHSISFSRPVIRPVYIIANVTANALEWPADGEAQVKAAIVAWGDVQKAGKDVVSNAIGAQAFKVAGVLDVVALISLSNPPGATTTIPIGLRDLASYDTSRIVVNVTFATP